MITRKLRIQIVLFVVIALVGVTYVGAKYVGVGRLAGVQGYSVTVDLPRAGGLFENGEVTYRGVPVGRVSSLTAGPSGVHAVLLITDTDLQIPADSEALVRNRSAIGEQYLDLRPSSDAGPYLTDGDHLDVTENDLPVRVDALIDNVVALNDSIPTKALSRLVDEIYLAARGSGRDLGDLLDSSTELAEIATEHLPGTTALIDDGETVLQTQSDRSADIRSIASNLRLLAAEVREHDPELRALINATPGAAREITLLIQQAGGPLSQLLRNFLVINGVLAYHSVDLESVLSNLPKAVSEADSAFTPTGLRVGLSTNFTDPLPCTQGYRQPLRRGTATGDVPLMLGSGCSTGLPRGATSAPRY